MIVEFFCPWLRLHLLQLLSPTNLLIRPREVWATLFDALDLVFVFGFLCAVLLAILGSAAVDLVKLLRRRIASRGRHAD